MEGTIMVMPADIRMDHPTAATVLPMAAEVGIAGLIGMAVTVGSRAAHMSDAAAIPRGTRAAAAAKAACKVDADFGAAISVVFIVGELRKLGAIEDGHGIAENRREQRVD